MRGEPSQLSRPRPQLNRVAGGNEAADRWERQLVTQAETLPGGLGEALAQFMGLDGCVARADVHP